MAFERAYRAWFDGEGLEPNYWLAAAEMGALLTFGTTYYWLRPNINRPDWDFSDPFTRLASLEVTFDNNRFETNHLLHPLAGGAYYLFARQSELSPLVALSYSAGSSAVFEFLLEWLEKVSINDLIFTPGAGVPAGEFVFQLSEYLNSAPGKRTTAQTAFAYSLGLASALHGGPRGKQSQAQLPADNLGLSSAWWHRFRVAYGIGKVEAPRGEANTFHRFRLDADLFAMPGLLRPGQFATTFGQGNFTDMRLRLGFSDRGLIEANLWFRSVLAGYYAQRFTASPETSGEAAMIGASMAWRYHDRVPLGLRDRYAFVHLLGPTARTWLAHGGFLLRTETDAHFDFGAVHSLPYEQYTDTFGEDGMKSVLQNYSYAFVRGLSARLSVSAEYGGVELGVRQGFGYYGSLEGKDRFQDDVYRDTSTHDQINELDAWLILGVPSTPLEFRFDYNRIARRADMKPLWAQRIDRAMTASVGARF